MNERNDAPRIEVTVAAPVEQVWRALRDPALIRRWHGWLFDGLDEEIRTIFVDGGTEDAERYVLVVQGGDRFSLHPTAGGTIVRVTRAPRGTDPEWDAYYDDVTEGWTTFLLQLRFGLERHNLAERRTLVLEGAPPHSAGAVLTALGLGEAARQPEGARYRATVVTGDLFEGEVYARTEHQQALTVDGLGDGLLVVAQQPRNPQRPDGGVMALLTTYGIAEDDFEDIERRWTAWWESGREEPSRLPSGP